MEHIRQAALSQGFAAWSTPNLRRHDTRRQKAQLEDSFGRGRAELRSGPPTIFMEARSPALLAEYGAVKAANLVARLHALAPCSKQGLGCNAESYGTESGDLAFEVAFLL